VVFLEGGGKRGGERVTWKKKVTKRPSGSTGQGGNPSMGRRGRKRGTIEKKGIEPVKA